MGEIAASVRTIVGKLAAGSISPAVSTILLVSGRPTLAVVAGLVANAAIEEGARLAFLLDNDARERVETFVAAADEISEDGIDQLLSQVADDAATRELFRRVAEEVVRSTDESRIHHLARVFVACGTDLARVNDGLVIVDLLRQLDGPHLQLLAVISRADAPHEVFGGRSNTFTPIRHEYLRGWGIDDLTTEVTGLHIDTLAAVASRLVSLGLIYDAGEAPYVPHVWAPTPLGLLCVRFLGAWADHPSA